MDESVHNKNPASLQHTVLVQKMIPSKTTSNNSLLCIQMYIPLLNLHFTTALCIVFLKELSSISPTAQFYKLRKHGSEETGVIGIAWNCKANPLDSKLNDMEVFFYGHVTSYHCCSSEYSCKYKQESHYCNTNLCLKSECQIAILHYSYGRNSWKSK